METVKIYLDNLRPSHLAVRNEYNQLLQPVCGAEFPGRQVIDVDSRELKLTCESCQEQFEIWEKTRK